MQVYASAISMLATVVRMSGNISGANQESANGTLSWRCHKLNAQSSLNKHLLTGNFTYRCLHTNFLIRLRGMDKLRWIICFYGNSNILQWAHYHHVIWPIIFGNSSDLFQGHILNVGVFYFEFVYTWIISYKHINNLMFLGNLTFPLVSGNF